MKSDDKMRDKCSPGQLYCIRQNVQGDEMQDTNCTNDELLCRQFRRCIPRLLVGTDKGCIFGKKGVTRLPCRENEFTCTKSRLCLARHQIKDGRYDCHAPPHVTDVSDESNHLPSCDDNEFQCQDVSKRCIPREWVLDGANDCNDTSDESQPLTQCIDGEFRCRSGQCIARYRVQDGYSDCRDGDDEVDGVQSPLTCFASEFRCEDSGRCIPRSWVRDGISNCVDRSDETISNFPCLELEFTCYNKYRCLPKEYVCDGMNHCGDCSDEIEGCKEPRMSRCPENASICIQQSYACDGFTDCPGGKDNPEYLPSFKCSKSTSVTSETECVIPQWTLHDDFAICEDRSDICFDSEGTFTCSRCASNYWIIANRQVCNGYVDCDDLTDECICDYQNSKMPEISRLCNSVCYTELSSAACEKCENRQLLCWEDEKCISLDRVCNGVIDCPLSKADEYACVDTPISTNSTKPSVEGNFTCLPIAPFLMNLVPASIGDFIADNATRCDGVIECARFEDECDAGCEFTPNVCNEVLLQDLFILGIFPLQLRACPNFEDDFVEHGFVDFLFPGSLCNGITECPGGEDEKDCIRRYQCDAGAQELPSGAMKNRTSILSTQTCDGRFDCLDRTDEINCSSTTHFYCEGGSPLFVPANRKLNGVQDCDDNSDECPPDIFADTRLSSRENLIGSPILRVLVWIMAAASVVGNFLVLVEILFALSRRKKSDVAKLNLRKIIKCNRILITSLAFADFLMGVALFMIAVESATSAGKYCNIDKSWRIGVHCSIIGIFTVLSSETSVLCMVALTCFRLYGVFCPVDARQLKPRRAAFVVIMLWIIAFILSVFPLIPYVNHTMITSALITPSKYFDNTVVTWDSYRTFVGRLHTLASNRNESDVTYDISSWTSAVESTTKPLYIESAPNIVGYFGYYSTDGVCIPRLFRLKGTGPLHPLTISVVCINFLCLIFIIVSYTIIYFKSTQNTIADSSSGGQKRSNSMQRKISILIATDLCCWLPICIMTFITQSEVYIF